MALGMVPGVEHAVCPESVGSCGAVFVSGEPRFNWPDGRKYVGDWQGSPEENMRSGGVTGVKFILRI